MESHQLLCERKGNFIEAEVSKQRVSQLRSIRNKKINEQIKSNQPHKKSLEKPFKTPVLSLNKMNKRTRKNSIDFDNKTTSNSTHNSFLAKYHQIKPNSMSKYKQVNKRIINSVNTSIDSKALIKIVNKKRVNLSSERNSLIASQRNDYHKPTTTRVRPKQPISLIKRIYENSRSPISTQVKNQIKHFYQN